MLEVLRSPHLRYGVGVVLASPATWEEIYAHVAPTTTGLCDELYLRRVQMVCVYTPTNYAKVERCPPILVDQVCYAEAGPEVFSCGARTGLLPDVVKNVASLRVNESRVVNVPVSLSRLGQTKIAKIHLVLQ